MASLPQFQGGDTTFQLQQNKWAGILNPLIANPANNSLILKNVTLQVGPNNIPHLLGRKLQGWTIVRKRGPADIYDQQDSNQTPALTLILVSDTAVTLDIEVL